MSSNVLVERDTNAQPTAANENEKPKSMECHRQMENKLNDQKTQQTYISPSDGILSPATQKLAAFKSKHMGKGAKPRSLFAAAMTKNAENASPNRRVDFEEIQQSAHGENMNSSAS